MPEPSATTGPPAAEAGPALPQIQTTLSREEILARLEVASRRGRLPGFVKGGHGTALFSVAAHGHPFDADLLGHFPAPGGLAFELRLRRKMPVVFATILIATVWPGAYFTDELIAQYLPELWRPWVTYYWYLPLTILPLPWVWRTLMRRSRQSTRTSAEEMIARIARELAPAQPTPR